LFTFFSILYALYRVAVFQGTLDTAISGVVQLPGQVFRPSCIGIKSNGLAALAVAEVTFASRSRQ
jgi:hypothetical protein